MKPGAWYIPGLVLALHLSAAPATAAPRSTCHIHPPQAPAADETPATTIGPFSRVADCETARARLFGDQGRCHCTLGFAPARTPDGEGRRAGPSAPGSQPGPDLP